MLLVSHLLSDSVFQLEAQLNLQFLSTSASVSKASTCFQIRGAATEAALRTEH